MPVNSYHPQYGAMLPRWQKVEDAIAGQPVVKAAGEKYMPMFQEDIEDYEDYVMRADFLGVTGRTRESLVGFIYRKDPQVNYPDILQPFMDDCTLGGLQFYDYLKERVRQVCGIGRSGTLIDYDNKLKRPFLRSYHAKDIINWKIDRVGNEQALVLLVLFEWSSLFVAESEGAAPTDDFEHVNYEQWREYRLLRNGEGEPYSQCRLWRKKGRPSKPNKGGATNDPTVEESSFPEDFFYYKTYLMDRFGKTINRIPFVFHGPNNCLADIDVLPMEEIANMNFSHYLTSADLENGLHVAGQPTPYAIGFNSKQEFKLGASEAWVCDDPKPGTMAGFIEFGGQGLESLEKAEVRKQAQMAALGARLFDLQQRDVEAYETARMRQTGETVTLSNIAISGTQAGTMILQWATWWVTAASTPQDTNKVANMELNMEFVEVAIDAQLWTTANNARTTNIYSQEAYFYFMQSRGMYPPDWTLEDEQEALAKAGLPEGANLHEAAKIGGDIPGGLSEKDKLDRAEKAAKDAAKNKPVPGKKKGK